VTTLPATAADFATPSTGLSTTTIGVGSFSSESSPAAIDSSGSPSPSGSGSLPSSEGSLVGVPPGPVPLLVAWLLYTPTPAPRSTTFVTVISSWIWAVSPTANVPPAASSSVLAPLPE
jgi:hypothetical protein